MGKKYDWEPDCEALLVGGPFDGRVGYFNPKNWTPDEVRYRRYHDEGIIEDLVKFSRNFPEGAVYRWNKARRYWEYIGVASYESRENFKKLLGHFDIEPRDPL